MPMADMKESSVSHPEPKRRWSRRKAVILGIGIAAVIIIGLAVGLGVGLTQGNQASPDNSDVTAPIPSPAPPAGNTTIWQPAVNSSWQIVLQDPIRLDSSSPPINPDVEVFDIDLFTNSKSTIDSLHASGKRVICYFSAGSYEPYRPDSSQFEPSTLGQAMDGWPDEKWIDIRSEDVQRIMTNRISLASQKGCDAIDPDNIDGYNNENGLDLSPRDSVEYLRYLSSQAAAYGLAIGVKNAAEIIPQVVSLVQFAVNEQCIEYAECESFAPLVRANKPVFHIEYPEEASSGAVPTTKAAELCSTTEQAAGRDGFRTVLKRMSLDGWVQYCDGSTADTPVSS